MAHGLRPSPIIPADLGAAPLGDYEEPRSKLVASKAKKAVKKLGSKDIYNSSIERQLYNELSNLAELIPLEDTRQLSGADPEDELKKLLVYNDRGYWESGMLLEGGPDRTRFTSTWLQMGGAVVPSEQEQRNELMKPKTQTAENMMVVQTCVAEPYVELLRVWIDLKKKLAAHMFKKKKWTEARETISLARKVHGYAQPWFRFITTRSPLEDLDLQRLECIMAGAEWNHSGSGKEAGKAEYVKLVKEFELSCYFRIFDIELDKPQRADVDPLGRCRTLHDNFQRRRKKEYGKTSKYLDNFGW